MKNILTVDFEGWMDTCTAQKYLAECGGKITYADRLPESASVLLDLLNYHGLKATFFVLGSVAEKYPEIVKRIGGLGHRIGSHGYRHKKIFFQNAEEFDADIHKSLSILSGLTSIPIESFRAPNWSIDRSCLWALKILVRYGFKYDSSFCCPSVWEASSEHNDNNIIEVPRSTVKISRFHIPFAGGFFLRAYPISITELLIRRANAKGVPVVLYVHPWELDCHCPKIPMNYIDGKIQYLGVNGAINKLKRIFDKFEFVPLEDFFNNYKDNNQQAESL